MRKPNLLFLSAKLCLGLMVAGTCNATTWDVDGVIDFCDDFACGLAGIASGDTIAGFLKADSSVSGPNSTFTEVDITDYLVSANGFSAGPADSTIDMATITTGPNGELVGGVIMVSGTVDGGVFGMVDVDMAVDIDLGTFSISTAFLGLGEVANGPFMAMLEADGDGLGRIEDNCTDVANADQRDTNADGFGNACDPDLNNDLIVDFGDLPPLLNSFFSQASDANWNPDADLNGDGVVDFGDLPPFQLLFFQPPGPSGVAP